MVNTTYKNTPFIRIYKQFDLFLVEYYHYCIINKKNGCFKKGKTSCCSYSSLSRGFIILMIP